MATREFEFLTATGAFDSMTEREKFTIAKFQHGTFVLFGREVRNRCGTRRRDVAKNTSIDGAKGSRVPIRWDMFWTPAWGFCPHFRRADIRWLCQKPATFAAKNTTKLDNALRHALVAHFPQ